MSHWPRMRAAAIPLGCLALGFCLFSKIEAQKDNDTGQLTARQLFFTTRPATPAPAPASNTPAPKPKPHPRAQASKPAPATSSPDSSLASTAPAPSQTESKASAAPYLGVRYTILSVDAHGNNRIQIDPQNVFHSGEHFLLSLESNDAGYLYVVLQASQGQWQVLFPRSDIRNGDNYIAAHEPILLPSASRPFFFDQHPGTENLFVVLSRQPEPDLDALIPIVQREPSGAEKGGSRQRNASAAPVMMASADFDRVRDRLASRGIEVEKPSAEKAVYTVNASTSDNSHVITAIVLKHE